MLDKIEWAQKGQCPECKIVRTPSKAQVSGFYNDVQICQDHRDMLDVHAMVRQEHHDEHDLDDGICLECGKDFREDMMVAAYDRLKDRMKYGNE